MTNSPFPWRAEDLPTDALWSRSGKDGWDYVAQRKVASGWDKTWPNPSDPVQNDEYVGHGVPVYAIEDGVVFAAWRNAPENPRPKINKNDTEYLHPGRTSNPKTIPQSGNFLAVLGDDGSITLYAHLQPGSIPTGLCPFEDEFVADADNKIPVAGTPSSVPVGTAIPAADRPRVTRGQFLGRVGNTGNSSGPHLHLHRRDSAGNKFPIPHDRGWKVDKADPTQREPFTGQVVDADDKHFGILASPLLRHGDVEAGGIGEVAMHFVRSRRVVTAVRDRDGNLKIIVWDMTPDGQLTRRGDATAGAASLIAIAEPRSDIVVTALRDGSGNLKLISWRITGSGQVTRCADAGAGAVSRVQIATVEEGVVVVAVRTGSGNMKLIGWSVAADGSFTRRGDADSEAVTEVSLCAIKPFTGAITAVRDGSGDLKLIAWQVNDDGAKIVPSGTAGAGAISEVAVISCGAGGHLPVTAVRDSAGDLRVIAWRLDSDGKISRRATGVAGGVTEVSLARPFGVSSSFVVACRDDDKRLRLITWELADDGDQINRLGGALAGSASRISSAATTDQDRHYVLTGCADIDGNLKLISWEANL